jgi:cyclase
MFLKPHRSAILSMALVSFTASALLAQQGAPPAGARGGGRGGAQDTAQAIVTVKPGLYMVTGAGANSMVRVANEGILVVDTKSLGQATYDALMAQIRTVSDKPVKFVIVGDVHQDKSGNTGLFVAAGAQVIAHENEKKGLETYTNAAGKPAAPNVTYKTDYSIRLDNNEVAHVYHFGAASTGGDSITYFPDLKVVIMGDVFQNGMNCDYAQGGSMIEWPKTLEAILKLDFDTVIPNRGNPATRADLEAAHKRVATIASTAIDLVKKGTPKDQLIAQINAVDSSLQVNSFLAINAAARLDAFYDEVSKAAK